MTEPSIIRDYNKEYQDSATMSGRYSHEFDDMLRKYMMRTFSSFISNDATNALELGCYKGTFTEILANHFDDLTVVEAADELIEFSRGRVGKKVKFIHSTFESAELDEQFDSIFLIHTLEHIDDPVLVLKKIKKWLSDKGKLFVAVPNANAASRQIAVQMGLIENNCAITDGEQAHGHRTTYSLDTLERDASSAGLTILQRGGIFFKALANFQFDKLIDGDIISDDYLEGCYKLGMYYPDLCASIYLVCK